MIEVRAGTPLLQEDREFAPEIIGIIENLQGDVRDNVFEIVARILGHNASYLEKFDFPKGEKKVTAIQESETILVEETDAGKFDIKRVAKSTGSEPDIILDVL